MSDEALPNSEIILYQTEDGRTRIQCRFENETLWLTQTHLAELFSKDVRTIINEHLMNIFSEGELLRESTIRKFRIVQRLQERFRFADNRSESESRAIRDTVEAGKIKLADPEQSSLRYRHYVPFWA